MVEAGVYVRVGDISIVDLAHLCGPCEAPTSACRDALQAHSLGILLPQTILPSMYCLSTPSGS